jgi:pimeloyl-ACP methyl ester carboxylesterase
LCGHSMGGAIAMQSCLARPDAVRALILADTGARLRVVPALFGMLKSDFQGAVNTMAQFAFGPGTPAAAVEEYKARLRGADSEIVYQDFAICDKFDIMARVGGIAVPTLILAADKDQLTPLKYSSWLHEHIPGSEMHVISGSGHSAMIESAAEFARLCREFILKLQ